MDLSQLVGKIGMMGGDTDTSFFSPSFTTSNYGQINKQNGFFSIDQSEFRCPKMARTETPSLYNTGWEKVTMNERNTLEELMRRVKGPFTPLQWMELEHQALIYKYINARAPVPTSLLVSICRNLMDPSSTATSFPNNTMGWGSMKYGRNGGDEEPGRCRRTDGKKWRCARNAMEEHKYCERHMVRNRHRSRKPVEPQTQQTPNPKRTRSFSNSSSSSATTPFMRASLNKEKEVLKSPSNLSFEPVISSNDVLNFARSSYSKNNFSFSSAIESPPHLLQDFIGELTKVKPSENSKLNEFDFTQIGPLGEILGKSSSEWATGC